RRHQEREQGIPPARPDAVEPRVLRRPQIFGADRPGGGHDRISKALITHARSVRSAAAAASRDRRFNRGLLVAGLVALGSGLFEWRAHPSAVYRNYWGDILYAPAIAIIGAALIALSL